LALPATAPAAETLYVSPAGSGDCSAGSPCEVGEALALALAGDTVVMAGDAGTYGTQVAPLMSELNVHNGVALVGAAGEPTPQIHSAAPGLPAVRLEGGRLSKLAIHYAGSRSAITGAGTIERVLALGGDGAGCELGGPTTVSNSVCAGVAGIFSNVGESTSLTLRNATIVGSDTGLFARSDSGAFQITAVNTILQGVDQDIRVDQVGSGTAVAIVLAHSNYETVATEHGASATAAGSGTNQVAAPLFVDAAGSNFAPLGGSPTIDAGLNDAANGPLDLAGNPRALPARIACAAVTDVGAYEFVPVPPACEPPPAAPQPPPLPGPGPQPPAPLRAAPPGTSIFKATIAAGSASFRFKASAGAAVLRFECRLDRKRFRPCRSPKSYRDLKPGGHRFAVRAVGPGGPDESPAIRKFRTL
jgi:hypothetical protein